MVVAVTLTYTDGACTVWTAGPIMF